ncbi:MAG TPA: hypothetical protein P5244_08965 [Syntrophales bacterium]|nr:hypothetical protein [Syntrophales bacterium]
MIDMKDIQPEHMYEAARPRPVGRSEKYYNDRYVILVDPYRGELLYDEAVEKNGESLHWCRLEEFLDWAGRDITADFPPEKGFRRWGKE